MDIYRHLKTGGYYALLTHARIEKTEDPVIVYISVLDPTKAWVRPTDEFFDGRFELIAQELLIKLQRPLMGDLSNYLLYDQDRKFQMMMPVAQVPDEVKEDMGDDPKGYFTVLVTVKATDEYPEGVTFLESAEDQDW